MKYNEIDFSNMYKSEYRKEKEEMAKKILRGQILVGLIALILLISFIAIDRKINTTIDMMSINLEATNEVLKSDNLILDNQFSNFSEDRKNRLLDCLAFLESGNDKNKIVYNDNNKGNNSRGLFQLQVETIIDYYKRYKKQDISTEDAIKLAHSPSQSRALTSQMIDDGLLSSKWVLSTNKIKAGKCYNFEADELNNYLK